MHKVLVNRLGGLSLPRKSVVRLTDRPDMTLDVYRGRKTTTNNMYTVTVLILINAHALIKASCFFSENNDIFMYSRLSLSRSRMDPLKHFEIAVLRHIRCAELRKLPIKQPSFTNEHVI